MDAGGGLHILSEAGQSVDNQVHLVRQVDHRPVRQHVRCGPGRLAVQVGRLTRFCCDVAIADGTVVQV
jgi:hypothetical protein